MLPEAWNVNAKFAVYKFEMKAKTEIFQKKKEARKLGPVTWFMHYKDLIFFLLVFVLYAHLKYCIMSITKSSVKKLPMGIKWHCKISIENSGFAKTDWQTV